MTGPDDWRRGLTPFDGGVRFCENDPLPLAVLVDKKGGDKNSRLTGGGEDPSPPPYHKRVEPSHDL
jgi:hypothetical protein